MNNRSGTRLTDASGHGNNGTLSASGLTLAVPGLTGDGDLAINFDGSAGAVDVPYHPSLNFTTGLSVECIIKPNVLQTGLIAVQDVGNLDASDYRWQLNVQPDGAQWAAQWQIDLNGTIGVVWGVTDGFFLTSGLPYHLLGTWDGSLMALYINGTRMGTTALSGGLNVTGKDVALGKSLFFGNFYSGVADEVALYASALSPARASAHNAAVSSTRPPTGGLSYNVIVGGADLSKYFDFDSWYVSQTLGAQGDTATLYFTDEHADGQASFVIKPLAPITLTDNYSGKVILGGLCSNPRVRLQSPNLSQWEVVCNDNTIYADASIVKGDFAGQTADTIIKSLVTQAACGITSNHVAAGPLIPRLQVNYKSLSEAIKLASRLASQSTIFGWYVDETLDLHWIDEKNTLPSGLYLTDNQLDTSPNAIRYSPGDQCYFEWDGSQLRNRCIVRGANFTNHVTKNWAGDGQTTSWALPFAVNTNTLTATLTVGGTSKTIAQDTGANVTSQFLVSQNPSGQWFLITGTDPAPASGAVISLAYNYAAPIVSQVDDLASQSEFPGPNAGIFSMYLADTSLQTVGAATARAQRELQQYGGVQERINCVAPEGTVQHFRTGDVLGFRSRALPDSENNFATGSLNCNIIIVQSRVQGGQNGWRTYQIVGVRIS